MGPFEQAAVAMGLCTAIYLVGRSITALLEGAFTWLLKQLPPRPRPGDDGEGNHRMGKPGGYSDFMGCEAYKYKHKARNPDGEA